MYGMFVTAIILINCVFGIYMSTDLPEYDHGLGLSTTRPLNIAHRASSGMYPENTLESVHLAIEQGADMIELDMCLTKDLHLVCLHESWIGDTTNVADIFPEERMNTYFVQGRFITDYFTVDFTLEELKQVRVKQRRSYRDHNYDLLFEISTLEESIIAVQTANRTVALLPEIKDPIWVNSLDILQSVNTTLEDILVNLLQNYGYLDGNDPLLIQSFSPGSIRYVSEISSFAVQFLTAIPLPNNTLDELSEYCYGIGATKELVIRINVRDQRIGVTDLVDRVRDAGLKIHVWTLRNEDQFLAWDYQQDPYLEYEDFVMNGLVDGVITDFPATFNRYLNVLYGNQTTRNQFELI